MSTGPPADQPASLAQAPSAFAFHILIEIAQTLASSDDECQRLARSLTLLKALLQCDRCSMFIDLAADGPSRVLSVPSPEGDEAASLKARLINLLCAVEDNSPVPSDSTEQVLALPLVGMDEVHGILAIERDSDNFTSDEVRILSLVAAQFGAYLTMLRLHREAVALDRFKREMSTLAAHDIKNPAAAVIGMVDFLSIELDRPPEHLRTCLNDIRSACNRIHRVTANMLDLARLESNQLPLQVASFDISALLATVVRQRTGQAAFRSVRILIRPAPPGTRVRIDEELFSRVIDNLLDNALRYAPANGRIELEARRTEKSVQVRVGNDGPPVPEPSRATIFEKVERGAEAAGARTHWGMGLYFARIAIEAQHGRIWLEHTPDLPTVFALEVPLAEDLPGRSAAAPDR